FAYVTGGALLAVDTFAALALQAPANANRVDVLEDAQQDKVYVQSFARPTESAWRPMAPFRIQPLADWLSERDPDAWVTGPGLRVYGSRLPGTAKLVETTAWSPQPESILRLGLTRYEAGEGDDLWSLEPLYLRPS